jgi:DNA gyrase subunit A
MLVTTAGIIIRTEVAGISIQGRNASGVKIMNLDEGVSVASIAKVRITEEDAACEEPGEEPIEEENEAPEE